MLLLENESERHTAETVLEIRVLAILLFVPVEVNHLQSIR
jgi:hypothetical protein